MNKGQGKPLVLPALLSSGKNNPSSLSPLLSQVPLRNLARTPVVQPSPTPFENLPVAVSVESFSSLTHTQPTPGSSMGAVTVGVGVGVGVTLVVLAVAAVIVTTIVLVCCAVRR